MLVLVSSAADSKQEDSVHLRGAGMPIVEQGHGIKKMGSSQSVSVIEQYVTTGGPLHRKTRGEEYKTQLRVIPSKRLEVMVFYTHHGLPW